MSEKLPKMRLNLRQVRTIILAVAFLWVAAGAGYWLGANGVTLRRNYQGQFQVNRTLPADKEILDFSLFWEVWDRLSATYVDKKALSPRQMVYGAIRGMVSSLNDPYTAFLPPEENKQVREDLNGAFEGVGIQLGYLKNTLAVIAPLSGTPAERAGVRAGDLIVGIDGQETVDVSLPEVVKLIRGPGGSQVKLTLLREGEKELLEVPITRDTILVPSVKLSFLENDIAHLKLSRFGERTSGEWLEAVDEIVSHQPLNGVILDLRNNPGGLLSGSVFIASEFLSSGVVVQQENSDGSKETFSVDRTGKITAQPLVVLVNKGSASASEIVAGALQDHQRAQVVGETSFGKGTIQEAYEMQAGSGLHVTIARWLLPSGRCVHDEGVTPDVEIEDDLESVEDEALEKAIDILLGEAHAQG